MCIAISHPNLLFLIFSWLAYEKFASIKPFFMYICSLFSGKGKHFSNEFHLTKPVIEKYTLVLETRRQCPILDDFQTKVLPRSKSE